MSRAERLIEKAKAYLDPGETVVAAVQGTYETRIMGGNSVREGVLLATDRRVVFYAKKVGGYELESFPYANISSFEQGRNMMGRHLTFFAVGNAVHMKWIKSDAAEFADALKARMSPAPPAAQAPDLMDQLRKLGELRDAGVLTQEEFDAKKAELLSRL